MSFFQQILLIMGMAIVTYLPRILPLLLLSSRTLPPIVMRWLEMIPPAVLTALLASELLLKKEGNSIVLFMSMDNTFLLASVPTFIIGWLTQSFFVTIFVGIVTVALLRQFI